LSGATNSTIESDQIDYVTFGPNKATEWDSTPKRRSRASSLEPHRAASAEVALCVDLLAPEGYGEIIGGGQRIHAHDLLMGRIREHNLLPEAFQWYLDFRRYGTAPHAGFGSV
jgi:aspartyl-tRNA synthetase